MPSWWTGKLKSKPKASSSPQKKHLEAQIEVGVENPKHWGERAREREMKYRNFDEVDVSRKCVDSSIGHPLPLPTTISSPLPEPGMGLVSLSASASAFESSVSSSGSFDEVLDLAFNRFSDPINGLAKRHRPVTEGRRRLSCSSVPERSGLRDISVSPTRNFHLHEIDVSNAQNAHSYRQNFTQGAFTGRTSSPSSSSIVQSSSTSPIQPRSPGLSPASPNRKTDLRRLHVHPLPRPPCSPSSSLTLRSPKLHWKKGKFLGRGTFGNVYIGFNSESGQMCAIKEVKVISDDSNSKESLRQLNQEISLLSQLSHPNIVQYYGSELADETLSIYLEYVSGGSIHKLLQEYGPFSEPLIRNYTAQILYGLAYLHGRNTVHRDIKGANILVDPNGEIKLADFGMAKHISSYTSIRSFKGSPYWMAPEIIMNANGYSLSVDIWSLGCTIFEMATSKPPWSQFEGVAAIFKIGNSKQIPEIPNHLSSEAKDFLRLCLQRDSAARPSASQLMSHPFVRDQTKMMVAKYHISKDIPPPANGVHNLPSQEFSFVGNLSSKSCRDNRLSQAFPLPLSLKDTSDFRRTRVNMSLPVSPCSSPKRQFKQTNRSCLPSPSHPMYSVEPTMPSNNLFSRWIDNSQIKDREKISPRRLSLGV